MLETRRGFAGPVKMKNYSLNSVRTDYNFFRIRYPTRIIRRREIDTLKCSEFAIEGAKQIMRAQSALRNAY